MREPRDLLEMDEGHYSMSSLENLHTEELDEKIPFSEISLVKSRKTFESIPA